VGTPIGGGSGGEPGLAGYPLNVYVAQPLSPDLSVGFVLTSLYGLGFEYESGWLGRYHAGRSELLTVDLVPTMSYRVGPVSLGLGINVRFARAKTTTTVDFGTAAFLLTGGAVGIPAGNDGSLSTRLDDWGVGATIGAVFEPSDATRIGVSYRSRVKTTLSGSANFDPGGPVGAAIIGPNTDNTGTADLTFPAAVIFGVSQKLSERWTLLADAQWTQWSSLQNLTLLFSSPAVQPIFTNLEWRDSWFVAAGVRYQHDDRWVFRTGIAYDQTPTRPQTSTPAIPDANGIWLDFGVGYAWNPSSKIDLAYGHIFYQDNPISLQATATGNELRGTLLGTIRGTSANFFGVQYSHKF
jgi:long-chain fatty acid transport protein